MTHRFKISPLNFPSKTLIWLYLGPDRERQFGQIIGSLTPPPSTYDHFLELQEATGKTFGAACGVVNVFVHHDFLNLGYGIDLYEALARYAAQRFDAPIVSSSYFGSTISPDAKRTWASKRLAQRVTLRGRCAWGGDLD